MPVYTNVIEITVTMDAESASTAHYVAEVVGRDAAESIRKRLIKSNPTLAAPEVQSSVEYREEI